MRTSKDLQVLEADIRHAPATERQLTMRMEFRLWEGGQKIVTTLHLQKQVKQTCNNVPKPSVGISQMFDSQRT